MAANARVRTWSWTIGKKRCLLGRAELQERMEAAHIGHGLYRSSHPRYAAKLRAFSGLGASGTAHRSRRTPLEEVVDALVFSLVLAAVGVSVLLLV